MHACRRKLGNQLLGYWKIYAPYFVTREGSYLPNWLSPGTEIYIETLSASVPNFEKIRNVELLTFPRDWLLKLLIVRIKNGMKR